MYTPYHSDKYPQRINPRNRNINYRETNFYFVTICTDQKKCLFGEPEKLNQIGKCALDGFSQISIHYPDIRVDKCVVMPNHVHAILVLVGNVHSLSDVVCSYKSYVTKSIHEVQPGIKVWQTSFHDHVIRNQNSYEKIWLYIDGNPQKWREDCFFCGLPQ